MYVGVCLNRQGVCLNYLDLEDGDVDVETYDGGEQLPWNGRDQVLRVPMVAIVTHVHLKLVGTSSQVVGRLQHHQVVDELATEWGELLTTTCAGESFTNAEVKGLVKKIYS